MLEIKNNFYMKRLILLLTLVTVCSSVFSQKIVKNETDEFTGRKVKETSYVTISDGFNCFIRMVDDSRMLNVGFNCGDKIYTMDDGAEFMIKLDNDSIITLNNFELSVADYISNQYYSHFLLKTRYRLPGEALNELKKHKIVIVRFITTDGYIERKVSKGNSEKLLKLFNLV
jgi:hypothetical protein